VARAPRRPSVRHGNYRIPLLITPRLGFFFRRRADALFCFSENGSHD
jgi:hypothetical protein